MEQSFPLSTGLGSSVLIINSEQFQLLILGTLLHRLIFELSARWRLLTTCFKMGPLKRKEKRRVWPLLWELWP
ncbi:hypothetical protein WJX73_010642 [Symbiochloris irregularis]|uniref:Uncharacterized protein n=1 Tax=Symbiochloris irregularis TaxID=706552 RepID=A0AAW1PK38_9CHLO